MRTGVQLSYLALLGGALIHQPAPHSSMLKSDTTVQRGEDPIPERQDAGLGGSPEMQG